MQTPELVFELRQLVDLAKYNLSLDHKDHICSSCGGSTLPSGKTGIDALCAKCEEEEEKSILPIYNTHTVYVSCPSHKLATDFDYLTIYVKIERKIYTLIHAGDRTLHIVDPATGEIVRPHGIQRLSFAQAVNILEGSGPARPQRGKIFMPLADSATPTAPPSQGKTPLLLTRLIRAITRKRS